jgi:hypothetical protein
VMRCTSDAQHGIQTTNEQRKDGLIFSFPPLSAEDAFSYVCDILAAPLIKERAFSPDLSIGLPVHAVRRVINVYMDVSRVDSTLSVAR